MEANPEKKTREYIGEGLGGREEDWGEASRGLGTPCEALWSSLLLASQSRTCASRGDGAHGKRHQSVFGSL